MAGNDWVNSYLEAILDVGEQGIGDAKKSLLLLRERGHFSPTRYFVEEVITGDDESDLHRSWVKAAATRSPQEWNTRLENMCWRIWNLARHKKQVAELKLARFVEDIIVPPRMIDIIVDGEVNEEYMRTLEILSKKLKFVEVDPMVKASKAIKDVQPELEKLRQKAVSKTMLLLITIHMPAVTRSPQERNTRLENMCWRIWNLARHKKQERKLKEMLNVDLSVKEGVERQLLICQKIYQKENEQMCLVICILMARVLKEECLGLVQLMLWRIGPISRKRRSCTSS